MVEKGSERTEEGEEGMDRKEEGEEGKESDKEERKVEEEREKEVREMVETERNKEGVKECGWSGPSCSESGCLLPSTRGTAQPLPPQSFQSAR